jgi:2-alkenal reductase
MSRHHHLSLLFLLIVLTLATTACQAISALTGSEDQVVTETQIDQQEIVAQAVATISAQLPTVLPVPTPAVQSITMSTDLEESLVTLYERVNPAVVNIFVFDARETLSGSGSGFVYDTLGHIITNNHVVTGASGLEVVFPDGQRRRAEVVGTDVDSDLAVIRLESLPEGVQPIPLGDSRAVRVGQLAVALGNPFEMAGSLSLGIVSGLGRTLLSDRLAEGGGRYSLPQVIQTDAAINPGNSGGPLLNLSGEVIGVNSAIRTTTGTNSGVGFSIPVNAVKRVIPALIAEGIYHYPYMGIRMSDLDLESQQVLELPQLSGAYVTGISADTPAEQAGLRAGTIDPSTGEITSVGDLIIAVDGQPINNTDDLISFLVFETEVGQTISLTVIRDGEQTQIPLVLGERP